MVVRLDAIVYEPPIISGATAIVSLSPNEHYREDNSRFRILLADSNLGINEDLAAHLRSGGFTNYVMISDHAEAFRTFQESQRSAPFHLVITNQKGKQRGEIGNGLDLIRQIKRVSPGTKTLLCTGSLTPVRGVADDVLQKVCDSVQLLNKVEKLLGITI